MGRGDEKMDCAAVQVRREPTGSEKEEVKSRESEVEGHTMLLGEACDSESARDAWIDAVEQALEFDSFERGEMHMDRGLDRVNEEGYYPLEDVPRWMI